MKMEIEQPIDPDIDPNGEDLLSKGKKSLLNGGSGKYTTKVHVHCSRLFYKNSASLVLMQLLHFFYVS